MVRRAVWRGLTNRSFIETFANVNPLFASSFLVAGSVSYEAYRFKTLPLMLEFDATVAKRFGEDRQWEVAGQPVLRWTSFPLNHILYTNLRVAPLGVSYVSGISPWELHWAGNPTGSRILNFLSVEMTFKADAATSGEWFIKSHHRSGIFGLVNDTHGGSTYITTGYRHRF